MADNLKGSAAWVIGELGSVFGIFGRLLLARRMTFIVLVGLAMVGAILDGVAIALVMPLVSALQGGSLGLPGVLEMLPLPESATVLELAALVAVVFLFKNLLTLVRARWSIGYITGLWQEWVERMVENVIYAPADAVGESHSGEIVAAALGETRESVAALMNLLLLMVSVFTFSAVYGVLWLTSWKVTLAVTLVMALLGFFVLRPMTRLAHAAGTKHVKALNASSTFLLEIVGGIRYIKSFCKEREFAENMRTPLREMRGAMATAQWMAIIVHPLIETVVILGFCAAVVYFSYRSPDVGGGFLPLLGVYAAATFRLYPVLTGLGAQWVGVISKKASAQRVVGLMEPRGRETGGSEPFRGLRSGIAFRGVDYTYPGRMPALIDFDAEFQKGRRIALVGESGSGKSTAISLLLGFLEPNKGAIRVDGVPLENLRLDSWRRSMGYVAQDGFIFHTTLSRNISLGRLPDDDPRIFDAARVVGLDDFVKTLSEGYDTVLGERGVKVSGGQRQRVALARAILMRPEILILDEAMNALDNKSALDVIEAMKEHLPQSTWILVGHRLSDTEGFDSILVLKEGRLIEKGKHRELMERRGYYHQLYQREKVSWESHPAPESP